MAGRLTLSTIGIKSPLDVAQAGQPAAPPPPPDSRRRTAPAGARARRGTTTTPPGATRPFGA